MTKLLPMATTTAELKALQGPLYIEYLFNMMDTLKHCDPDRASRSTGLRLTPEKYVPYINGSTAVEIMDDQKDFLDNFDF